MIAIGWIIYASVYAGFAISTSLAALLPLFLAYGLYFGFAEGTEKALVADLAPASRRGIRLRHLQRRARPWPACRQRPVRPSLDRIRSRDRIRCRRRARTRLDGTPLRRHSLVMRSRVVVSAFRRTLIRPI